YQLLGAIITRASGIPYPNYVQEAILQPLGMAATAFAPLSAGMAARCATGYDWRALSDELNPAPARPPVWPEGGLWSCGDDLAATAGRLAGSGPPPVQAPAPAPREYRPLLGIYARPGLGGWLLRLEWRDGKLTATFGEPVSWQLMLAPTSDPDTFTVEPGTG